MPWVKRLVRASSFLIPTKMALHSRKGYAAASRAAWPEVRPCLLPLLQKQFLPWQRLLIFVKDCWGVPHPPNSFLERVPLGGGLPVLALVTNHPVHGVLSQDLLDAIQLP